MENNFPMAQNFGGMQLNSGMSTGAMAAVAREAQEMQAAVFMARQFPRDPGRCLQLIEGDCQRITLAEKAIYSYPKGGQQVSGPSIRMAETIAQRWGNIDTGWKVIEKRQHETLCVASAWDLETNYRKRIEFVVEHNITKKNGEVKILTDEREIYELIANKASRRQRNCILAVIPGDVVEAATKKCSETLLKRKDIETMRNEIVSELDKFGVKVAQIEKRIGRKVTALTGQQYVQLKAIVNSLSDGQSSVDDWFEAILEPQKIVKMQNEAGASKKEPITPGEVAAKNKEWEEAISTFNTLSETYETNGGVVANLFKPTGIDPKTIPDSDIKRVLAANSMLKGAIEKGDYK
jgi:hypothetical protein